MFVRLMIPAWMGSFAVKGVEDATTIPKLLAELRARGWSADDLHKLRKETSCAFYAPLKANPGLKG